MYAWIVHLAQCRMLDLAGLGFVASRLPGGVPCYYNSAFVPILSWLYESTPKTGWIDIENNRIFLTHVYV